jgi:SAM-dependent methyltransferase
MAFWREYFESIRGRGPLKILDVASGSGAVVESAASVFGQGLPEFTCLDISTSAIQTLKRRFPAARCVVADVRSIPLASRGYDIVTSQFGTEYAGMGAFDELVRLLVDRGELAMLLHHRGGVIHRQCRTSLDAIRQMQTAGFIPHCIATFEAGFAALRGDDPEHYRRTGRRFTRAIKAMHKIIAQHGGNVADGAILRLYRDVRTIHERMPNYEPSDVLGWLRRMDAEINAYADRTRSMCDAALDELSFRKVCGRLIEAGFDVLRSEPLNEPGQVEAIAWSLVARKR